MKKMILSVSLLLTLIVSQSSFADNRHSRHGYGNYGSSGYGSRHYNRGFNRSYNRNNNFRRGNAYHYGGYSNRRGYNSFNISYGSGFGRYYGNNYRYRNSGRGSGDFVGGLVLGSLLSYPRYRESSYERVSYRTRPVTQAREVVYRNNRTVTTSATPKRRLLRDLQGDCFEVVISPNGDEIRSQLDSLECSF